MPNTFFECGVYENLPVFVGGRQADSSGDNCATSLLAFFTGALPSEKNRIVVGLRMAFFLSSISVTGVFAVKNYMASAEVLKDDLGKFSATMWVAGFPINSAVLSFCINLILNARTIRGPLISWYVEKGRTLQGQKKTKIIKQAVFAVFGMVMAWPLTLVFGKGAEKALNEIPLLPSWLICGWLWSSTISRFLQLSRSVPAVMNKAPEVGRYCKKLNKHEQCVFVLWSITCVAGLGWSGWREGNDFVRVNSTRNTSNSMNFDDIIDYFSEPGWSTAMQLLSALSYIGTFLVIMDEGGIVFFRELLNFLKGSGTFAILSAVMIATSFANYWDAKASDSNNLVDEMGAYLALGTTFFINAPSAKKMMNQALSLPGRCKNRREEKGPPPMWNLSPYVMIATLFSWVPVIGLGATALQCIGSLFGGLYSRCCNKSNDKASYKKLDSQVGVGSSVFSAKPASSNRGWCSWF